jgi:hypothetical protein
MDDELLRYLYHRLLGPARAASDRFRQFSDGVIALIYLLAVLQDRSPHWAANKRNWPLWLRRVLPCPSYSQLIRRLKTASVVQLIGQVNAELREHLPRSALKCCDGKPLVVGGFSKDPDARWGKVPDGWAKGYKLHVVVDSLGAIEVFAVTPLNAYEAKVAARLVCQLDLRQTLIRADASYDSNVLYAAVNARGGRLLAPRRRPGRGLGHCTQHPDRLRAIAELEGDPATLKAHRRERTCVERILGQLTNLPFGLSPLPNFARRLRRVSLWVLGKITLYHLHANLCLLKAKAA